MRIIACAVLALVTMLPGRVIFPGAGRAAGDDAGWCSAGSG